MWLVKLATVKVKLEMVKVFLLVISVLTTGLITLAQDGPVKPQIGPKSAPELQPKDNAERVGKEHMRNDRFGDALPPGAIARLGTVRLRHDSTVTSVAISSNGKIVASAGGEDQTVRLWDRGTGQELHRCVGHRGEVSAVAFASKGDVLASAGADGTVRLWRAGKAVHVLKGRQGFVWCVSFSPDGKMLASAGKDGAVRLWEVATGKEVARLVGHQGEVYSVAFDSDGKRLASGGVDRSVRLWDVGNGKELRQFSNEGQVSCVAFSPDGKILGSQAPFKVDLWDAANGALLGRLGTATVGDSYAKFAFAPDSKSVAYMTRQLSVLLPENDLITVSLFDVATGKEFRQFGRFGARVRGVAFAPDDKTLATGSGYAIQLWDTDTGREVSPAEGHTSTVGGLAFSPDGNTLATAGQDRTVRLWDAATGRELHRLGGHQGMVWCVSFSPDGRRLVSGSLESAPNSDLRNRELLHPLRIWDAATGRQLLSWHANTGGMVQAVAFSPDGKELASLGPPSIENMALAGKQVIEFWDPESGKQLRRIAGSPGNLAIGEWGRAMAYAPNGKALAVGGQGEGAPEVWLLDPLTGKVQHRLGAVKGNYSYHCLAFSSDGKMLASASRDRTVRVWDVATGKESVQLKGHQGGADAVAFTPGAKYLVTGGVDKTVRLWNLTTGKQEHKWTGHASGVGSVAISRDGSRVASAGHDTTVLVWNLKAVQK
jgi:WD40 repeat protein